VKNAEIVGEYAREKEQQLAAKKAELVSYPGPTTRHVGYP
jgi:hypothetical protein